MNENDRARQCAQPLSKELSTSAINKREASQPMKPADDGTAVISVSKSGALAPKGCLWRPGGA